jgi:hypothetical protein
VACDDQSSRVVAAGVAEVGRVQAADSGRCMTAGGIGTCVFAALVLCIALVVGASAAVMVTNVVA